MQKESLLEKKQALDALDKAKFGWFHVKACLVSGIGFFTDAYDLFVIQLVALMIGMVYYHPQDINGDKVKNEDALYPLSETLLKQSALVGTLVGQLLFGYLADLLGRKKMYGTELMIIIFCTVTSAFASNTPAPGGITVIGMLIMWRFFLGVGIGGDYPLSAIITSEFANTKNRGAMIAAVFAMQGFGILTGSIVALIVLFSFSSVINNDDPENYLYIDYIWRILVGFGAIPGLIAVYFRMTIPETPRFTMDVKGNIEKAAQNVKQVLGQEQTKSFSEDVVTDTQKQQQQKPSLSQLKKYLSKWKNGKVLMGTSLCWFFLDIGFYGINLNNSTILANIGFIPTEGASHYEILQKAIYGNLITSALGTVPGYWLTVLLVDKMGRIPIQKMGFGLLSIIFLAMAFLKNHTGILLGLFICANLFNNFGPNATTFIIPGEVFPTKYRSTCHGISAASGKLGAIISQVYFLALGKENFEIIMIIFSACMVIGFIFTFFIPETNGKSLEDISEEQQTLIELQPCKTK